MMSTMSQSAAPANMAMPSQSQPQSQPSHMREMSSSEEDDMFGERPIKAEIETDTEESEEDLSDVELQPDPECLVGIIEGEQTPGQFGQVTPSTSLQLLQHQKPPRSEKNIREKLQILDYASKHSLTRASRIFAVDRKSIRRWRDHKETLEKLLAQELACEGNGDLVTPRKRIPGAGRKKAVKVIVELAENPNKRHRRTIKLSDKAEIIRLIENGQTQSDVARSLGISQSTVQTIWSNKQDILDRYSDPKRKRKNLHWKKYSSVDHALYTWYQQCRETGVPVDGKMLVDKATEYAEYFKQPDFKPQAIRWIDMFKKRHSIHEADHRTGRMITSGPASQHSHSSSMDHHQHHSQNLGHPYMPHSGPPNAHDMVPDFDLSSLPALMNGLYPPDPSNPNGGPPLPLALQQHPSAAPPLPTPNFNTHLPLVVSMPVTTCDAMKYVELIRSWIASTFGENEEILSNHLNAIENSILKRRMAEMMVPPMNSR